MDLSCSADLHSSALDQLRGFFISFIAVRAGRRLHPCPRCGTVSLINVHPRKQTRQPEPLLCRIFFVVFLFCFVLFFFQVQHCLFNKRDIKHPRMNFRDWTVKTCILESLTGCYIFRVFFTNLIKTCVGINPVSWIISVKMRCGYLSAQVIFSQYIWTELTQWTLFILSSVSSVLVLQQWHQEVFLFYIHSCRSLQIWF